MPYEPGNKSATDGQRAYNRIIYEDSLLRIGLFRCRPWEDLFHDDDQALGRYLVFPRTGVLITPDGGEPLVADPTVVMFYNKFQTYRRQKLSESGDACAYVEFDPQVLANVLPHYDPLRDDGPSSPFHIHRAPSDPRSYLLQHLIVTHILRESRPDSLVVQETMMQVLERIVERALLPASSSGAASQTRHAHTRLAREAQALVATRFHESLTLDDIAAQLYVSPYHLCRVFRQQTGATLHQYRNDLRLRRALEHVLGGENDLAALAGSLGYANHSHFTKAFRRQFQTTPSELRDSPDLRVSVLADRRRQQMSKNLTVR